MCTSERNLVLIYLSSHIRAFRNQKKFAKAMYEGIKAICEGGNLGPMEMIVMYGFRDQDGRLDANM
jgi:hypothetical protein